MLDKHGYRPNVGIILLNRHNQVFWGKRIREQSWQFPQGGINPGESPEQAMFRELQEETGLQAGHVKVIGRTRNWLRYDVPSRWVRREWRGHYRGQKQIWFLLRLLGHEENIMLDASDQPEFDAWRWSDYWVPLDDVIDFKRGVYLQALTELAALLKAPPRRPPAIGRMLANSKPPRPPGASGRPQPKAPRNSAAAGPAPRNGSTSPGNSPLRPARPPRPG